MKTAKENLSNEVHETLYQTLIGLNRLEQQLQQCDPYFSQRELRDQISTFRTYLEHFVTMKLKRDDP